MDEVSGVNREVFEALHRDEGGRCVMGDVTTSDSDTFELCFNRALLLKVEGDAWHLLVESYLGDHFSLVVVDNKEEYLGSEDFPKVPLTAKETEALGL